MKKTILFSRLGLLLMVFFAAQSLQAQTLKDVFTSSETPIFYLGVDFTKTKIIDDPNANVNDIRDRQYTGINDLIITEEKKFDLKSAFHRNSLDHDLSMVDKRNEKANTEDIKSTNSADYHRLKEEDINALVRGFDFGDKKGIGLLFVMEAMSKGEKSIAMWATLIDMKSKKVLMTERVEGKLGMGFGFRNYYATGIKNAIDHIEKKQYEEWKAKYGK